MKDELVVLSLNNRADSFKIQIVLQGNIEWQSVPSIEERQPHPDIALFILKYIGGIAQKAQTKSHKRRVELMLRVAWWAIIAGVYSFQCYSGDKNEGTRLHVELSGEDHINVNDNTYNVTVLDEENDVIFEDENATLDDVKTRLKEYEED